jgi:hypothetical protein
MSRINLRLAQPATSGIGTAIGRMGLPVYVRNMTFYIMRNENWVFFGLISLILLATWIKGMS